MQAERGGGGVAVMWSLNIAFLLHRLLWWPNNSYYFLHAEAAVLSKQGPTCGCDHHSFTSACSGRPASGLWEDRFPAAHCAGTQIRRRNITAERNKERVIAVKRDLILFAEIQCSECVVKSDNCVTYCLAIVTVTNASNKRLPFV